jgi:hypothetical protein
MQPSENTPMAKMAAEKISTLRQENSQNKEKKPISTCITEQKHHYS